MRKNNKIIKNIRPRSIIVSEKSLVKILIKPSRKYKDSDIDNMKSVALHLLKLSNAEYKNSNISLRKVSIFSKYQNNLFCLGYSTKFYFQSFDSTYGITYSSYVDDSYDINTITNYLAPDKSLIKKVVVLEQEAYNIIKNLILT